MSEQVLAPELNKEELEQEKEKVKATLGSRELTTKYDQVWDKERVDFIDKKGGDSQLELAGAKLEASHLDAAEAGDEIATKAVEDIKDALAEAYVKSKKEVLKTADQVLEAEINDLETSLASGELDGTAQKELEYKLSTVQNALTAYKGGDFDYARQDEVANASVERQGNKNGGLGGKTYGEAMQKERGDAATYINRQAAEQHNRLVQSNAQRRAALNIIDAAA